MINCSIVDRQLIFSEYESIRPVTDESAIYGTKFEDIFRITLIVVTLALVIPAAIYFKGVFSAIMFMSVAAILFF